jgi:uncharacterized protein YjbI with pentapeptide repeats
MAGKKPMPNAAFQNYVELVRSYQQNNSFRSWNAYREKKLKGKNPDLSYQNFEGFDLRGANLKGVDFTGSRLRRANLSGSDTVFNDLTRTVFNSADLVEAKLSNTVLRESSFIEADLREDKDGKNAILDNAILEGSNWNKADVIPEQLATTNVYGAKNLNLEMARIMMKLIMKSLAPSSVGANSTAGKNSVPPPPPAPPGNSEGSKE